MPALVKNAHVPMPLRVCSLIACLAVCAAGSLCWAQAKPDASALGNGEQEYWGVFLPTDRLLSRGIHQAKKHIAKGEFTRAIRFLDELLNPSKEDAFVKLEGTEEYVGLKETARKILRDLPPEGREAYETTFAPVARRNLRKAVESGDVEALEQVSLRYFFTPAGFEATLLMAANEADQGRHFAAALAYQQLLDTPEAARRFQPQLSIMAACSWLAMDDQPRAQKLIENLRSEGYKSVNIAGNDFRLDQMGEHPLDWLKQTIGTPIIQAIVPEDQWLTFGGNAARNGQVAGGLPHMRVRWEARLLSHHRLEALHSDLLADRIRGQKPVPVAATPLAVENLIITRSAHNLVAVDFQTGKFIWQVEPQRVPEFKTLLSAPGNNPEDGSRVRPTRSFSNRIWEDRLYNSLSSDGQRVYVIRDLSLPSSNGYEGFAGRFRNGHPSTVGSGGTNRLCAFDLATQGKLVWEIDGAAAQGDFEGAFFLGSPLAVGESLYCLVEIKSAVYLVAVDRLTGKLLSRQQLANLENGILHDPRRRLQASVPSYEDGILVCPTGAGVVVGVDLAKNALAWAYRYQTNQTLLTPFTTHRNQSQSNEIRWIDSVATIANGCVVLTPPESNYLHCLDLSTGKLLWKQNREQHLFVAGVHQDRVLLVGSRDLTAVRLSNGEPVWESVRIELPEESTPTGRGFFSKGQYFLPLSSAEVVAVDMELGTIVDRAIARDGQVLGNLVCHKGAVLSQNGHFLDRFDQIDVLRNSSEELLAKDPTDSEALRTLGEIAYNEGQISQSIDLLQQAYQSSPEDLRTQEVLIEALVIALDENFATFRDQLPLLRKLQDSSESSQFTLLRLEAHGRLKIGDPVGAFEVCLLLFEGDHAASGFLSLGRHHEVELSRWLRAETSAIWQQASGPEREQIAVLLQKVIDQLPKQSGTGEHRRLVECMGNLEGMLSVVLKLAKHYAEEGKTLESQQLLLRLTESGIEGILGTVHAEAVALCSLALHQANLPRLAFPFDQQLRGSLAGIICLEGKTGNECFEQWGADAGNATWPYGKVEVSKISPKRDQVVNNMVASQWGIRLERCDEVLGRSNIVFSPIKSEVVVYDSLGNEFYRASLANRKRMRGIGSTQVYAVSRGNLLLVSFGRQLAAFDTLASDGEPLWRKEVTNTLSVPYQPIRVRGAQQGNRPGSFRSSRAQVDGKWVGVIGPLTRDSCIFQDQHKLTCVDSQTGEVRWTRSDVPAGCDLYGDEDYVFVVPPSSRNALVFSTVDGRSVSQVSVPPWEEQLATIGRNVIRWRTRVDGRRELFCFDAFAGKTLWRYDFETAAKVDIAMGRYVAVVEPRGHGHIIDAHEGRRIVDQEIIASPKAQQIHLLAGSDRFVLAIQKPSSQRMNPRVTPLNRVDYLLMDGEVYVFDKQTGAPSWKRPAEVDHQSFVLSQPVDAPVVAFVGNIARRSNRGSQQGISMLMLEKATGRLLFSDDALPASRGNYCAISASGEEAHEVLIEMSSQSIRLAFTDKKRPPEPPAVGDIKSSTQNGHKGLQGIGRKLLGAG